MEVRTRDLEGEVGNVTAVPISYVAIHCIYLKISLRGKYENFKRVVRDAFSTLLFIQFANSVQNLNEIDDPHYTRIPYKWLRSKRNCISHLHRE